jgi:hypothetical protein
MSKLSELLEFYPDETFLKADGFDDAIIGITYDKENGGYRLVYSKSKCIKVLMERDKMSYEIALEYFDYNVEGAYVGKETPIWVDDEMFNENEQFETFNDFETNDGEADE